MHWNNELTKILKEAGADLVGFADLAPLQKDLPEEWGMPFGVSVAVAIPPHIIRSIKDGPNREYFNTYNELNQRLNGLVTLGADYLISKGYNAHAQTTDVVVESQDRKTALPHKTVAARAGLGWIGKCALLVTEQYGSAVRISSLVTDANLPCGQPVEDSRCGKCTACVSHCPGQAVTGVLWNAELDREDFFNASRCGDTARALSLKMFGENATICGKCIEICPYTRRYVTEFQ